MPKITPYTQDEIDAVNNKIHDMITTMNDIAKNVSKELQRNKKITLDCREEDLSHTISSIVMASEKLKIPLFISNIKAVLTHDDYVRPIYILRITFEPKNPNPKEPKEIKEIKKINIKNPIDRMEV
jgi:hypothetical protein